MQNQDIFIIDWHWWMHRHMSFCFKDYFCPLYAFISFLSPLFSIDYLYVFILFCKRYSLTNKRVEKVSKDAAGMFPSVIYHSGSPCPHIFLNIIHIRRFLIQLVFICIIRSTVRSAPDAENELITKICKSWRVLNSWGLGFVLHW